MKLKDLNVVIREGDFIIYDLDKNIGVIYDNQSKKLYEDFEVIELYPIDDIVPTVVIEVCKEVHIEKM